MNAIIVLFILLFSIPLLPLFFLLFSSISDVRECRRKWEENQEEIERMRGRKK
jgi:hypothetical protein